MDSVIFIHIFVVMSIRTILTLLKSKGKGWESEELEVEKDGNKRKTKRGG